MRAEDCAACPWRVEDRCSRKDRECAKVKGCSRSPQGRKFFRARSGAEAFRMKLKPKGTTKKEVTP